MLFEFVLEDLLLLGFLRGHFCIEQRGGPPYVWGSYVWLSVYSSQGGSAYGGPTYGSLYIVHRGGLMYGTPYIRT